MRNRGRTGVFGIIGASLSHSLSPAIHNYLFKMHRLCFSYWTFEVPESSLDDALRGIRALGIGGVNVTFPYKEQVLPYLDGLDRNARDVQAVNTILNRRGKLIGYNTDILGVRATFRDRLGFRPDGKIILVLGAGGAARACVRELIRGKARKILILNRTLKHARDLASSFRAVSAHTEIEAFTLERAKRTRFTREAELMVNATSAGAASIADIARVLTRRCLRADGKVFDLNWGDRSVRTKLASNGRQFEDGLYMLCRQAAESFRVWTGFSVDQTRLFTYVRGIISRGGLKC